MGDVFVEKPLHARSGQEASPDRCNFAVTDAPGLVSSSEREALNGLLKLGFHFKHLAAFVDSGRTHAKLQTCSLYRRALATGVSELLDVYRAAILQVQQHMYHHPSLTLAGLQHLLLECQMILPAVHQLVHIVQQDNISGSNLLHLLHSKAQCGIPELQSCLTRLLWHCNQVLFKQLSAWMVHGLLQDKHQEFFIQPASSQVTPPQAPPSPPHHPKQQPRPSQDTNAAEWHQGFQVSMQALPPGVTVAIAESILFVGKAVRVLQRPTGPLKNHDLLPQSDAISFAKALRQLQQEDVFDQIGFERKVELIRTTVTAQLWQLVVVHAELPAHLAALKNYFLLAKGDFYHSFLAESYDLMRLPPREATAEGDLTIPFQQSALKSTADQDPFFQHLKIRYVKAVDTADHPQGQGQGQGKRKLLHVPKYDKWDNVFLDYRVDWPLHLLLTPQVMAKYNVIFQYLLRLKRIQGDLESSWAVMRRQAGRSRDLPLHTRRLPLWHLRHHMAYIIANLQIYVQVDVIEAQSSILSQCIANARDFSEAERAHQTFLDAVVTQSFLDMKAISQMLEGVFSLCQRLCGFVQKDDGNSDTDAADPDKIAGLAAEFRRRANMLYTLLQSNKLQSSQRAPYLRQFLLRINFNGYVENEAVRQLRQGTSF
ncbi:Gamma-tubulin complex component 4 [Trebouxia sp. C0009 RCD-2024]